MKFCLNLVALIGFACLAGAQPSNKNMGVNLKMDIPLLEAIRQANEEFPDTQPLTEQDVIAAIQTIKLIHPDLPEAIYEIYQKVANEKVLPKGMYFCTTTRRHKENGVYKVDSKDLCLNSIYFEFEGGKIADFMCRIRSMSILSKPISPKEPKPVDMGVEGGEQDSRAGRQIGLLFTV